MLKNACRRVYISIPFFLEIIKLPGVTKKEFKNNFKHKGIKEIRIISTWGVFKFNIKGEEFIVRPWLGS